MEMSNQGWLIFQSYTVEVPLRKIEIQTETACHDLFSLLLVCMAITRYKLYFERVLRIFLGISPALLRTSFQDVFRRADRGQEIIELHHRDSSHTIKEIMTTFSFSLTQLRQFIGMLDCNYLMERNRQLVKYFKFYFLLC